MGIPKLIINNVDMYTAKGFILKSWEYEEGEVQTKYVDVPGRATPIDLTTYLTGSVVKGMPTITVTMIKMCDTIAAMATAYKDFCDTYNGLEWTVTRTVIQSGSTQTDKSYNGRLSVTGRSYDYKALEITFQLDVKAIS